MNNNNNLKNLNESIMVLTVGLCIVQSLGDILCCHIVDTTGCENFTKKMAKEVLMSNVIGKRNELCSTTDCNNK